MTGSAARWRALFTGTFARRLSLTVRGAVVGQALVLALTPVLSRLYDPSDFGILSFYQNVFGIVMIAASLRLELAVPMARDARQATTVALLGVLASFGFGVVLIPVAWMWSVLDPVTEAAVRQYWYFLPVGAAALGATACIGAWAAYYRAYRMLGRSRIAQSVMASCLQLAWPLASSGPFGLIAAAVVGQLGGGGALAGRFILRARRVRRADLAEAAARLGGFIATLLPAGLIGRAAVHLPMPVFLILYGPEAAGLIFLSQRILAIPTSILGRAAAIPVQQALGRAGGRGPHARAAVLLPVIAFGALGLAFIGPVAIGGPDLFALLLGEAWRVSGDYARLLAPMLLLQVVASPFAQVLAVTGRVRRQLAVESLRLALVAAAVFVPWWLKASVAEAVLTYSLTMSVIYAGYLLSAFLIAGRSETA